MNAKELEAAAQYILDEEVWCCTSRRRLRISKRQGDITPGAGGLWENSHHFQHRWEVVTASRKITFTAIGQVQDRFRFKVWRFYLWKLFWSDFLGTVYNTVYCGQYYIPRNTKFSEFPFQSNQSKRCLVLINNAKLVMQNCAMLFYFSPYIKVRSWCILLLFCILRNKTIYLFYLFRNVFIYRFSYIYIYCFE